MKVQKIIKHQYQLQSQSNKTNGPKEDLTVILNIYTKWRDARFMSLAPGTRLDGASMKAPCFEVLEAQQWGFAAPRHAFYNSSRAKHWVTQVGLVPFGPINPALKIQNWWMNCPVTARFWIVFQDLQKGPLHFLEYQNSP